MLQLPIWPLVTTGSLVAGHQRFGASAAAAALRCVEATPAWVGSAAAVHRFVDAACIVTLHLDTQLCVPYLNFH